MRPEQDTAVLDQPEWGHLVGGCVTAQHATITHPDPQDAAECNCACHWDTITEAA